MKGTCAAAAYCANMWRQHIYSVDMKMKQTLILHVLLDAYGGIC